MFFTRCENDGSLRAQDLGHRDPLRWWRERFFALKYRRNSCGGGGGSIGTLHVSLTTLLRGFNE